MEGRRIPTRVWWIWAATLAWSGCDLRDVLTTDTSVVAKAGDHVLTVDQLAGMLAQEESRIALRRDILERYVHRWLEYSLFAQRVARGDSLLDSATVEFAMWPDVEQQLVDWYHDRLVAERVSVDDATVDSVFRASDRPWVQHVLIRRPEDSVDVERARDRAEAVRRDLERGGSWAAANRLSDDSLARERGGNLGVIRRGQMVPAFEQAAFALQPGEISPVTETAFGFHVLRRPPLEEVHDGFEAAVTAMLIARMDSAYVEDLLERWNVTVRATAPAQVREAAETPLRVMGSRKVLATYRGGKFTVARFVLRLQALPIELHQQVLIAEDEQLMEFVRSLVKNEIIVQQARAAGAHLDSLAFRDLKERLREQVADVRAQLAIDSALAAAPTEAAQMRSVADGVDAYVARLAGLGEEFSFVPPFLAHKLRDEGAWTMSPRALDRALERAGTLQEARRGPREEP